MWYLDLIEQVRRVLRARHGGTGNDKGAALYTVRKMGVRRAETIDPGMIVRSREFDKADAWDDDTYDDPIGVVLGHWLDDGRIDEHDGADQFEFVAVVTAGIVRVLLHEDVDIGEYAFPTEDTTGAARGEADPDVGMLGRFVSMGTAGGYAYVKLGGGGGGGGGAGFDDGQVEAHFSPAVGGQVAYSRVPYSGIITGWTMIGDDPAGDAVVDVWVETGARPDAADSIVAAAPPTLSSDDYATSTTLTGWTPTITAGDVIGFSLDSLSIHQSVVVALHITRTS